MKLSHPLLKRQLRRHFGSKTPPELEAFIAQVQETYVGFERDQIAVTRFLKHSRGEETKSPNSCDHSDEVPEATPLQHDEAMGHLAIGIAQDFNRLLDTILGYTAMLAQRMADQPEAAHIVEEIARASEQAAGLSRQLFTFSRGDVEGHQPLHLSTVVHDMERILERIIDTNIRYEADSPEDVWPVSADPTQVEQVLLNFMINARDALENGGTIKVRYENVTLEDGLEELGLDPGSYVLLSVSDDGPGIDPNHLNNIFDPFFTTKEDEKAAGLGLSTVHGIMKQNHGAVLAKSAPGEGATFCAYFPRSYEEPGTGPNGMLNSSEGDFRKAA